MQTELQAADDLQQHALACVEYLDALRTSRCRDTDPLWARVFDMHVFSMEYLCADGAGGGPALQQLHDWQARAAWRSRPVPDVGRTVSAHSNELSLIHDLREDFLDMVRELQGVVQVGMRWPLTKTAWRDFLRAFDAMYDTCTRYGRKYPWRLVVTSLHPGMRQPIYETLIPHLASPLLHFEFQTEAQQLCFSAPTISYGLSVLKRNLPRDQLRYVRLSFGLPLQQPLPIDATPLPVYVCVIMHLPPQDCERVVRDLEVHSAAHRDRRITEVMLVAEADHAVAFRVGTAGDGQRAARSVLRAHADTAAVQLFFEILLG